MTYLITFGCYGARLHGSESGSVDRFHHLPGSRMLGVVHWRLAWERNALREAPYLLDSRDRDTVLAAIREVCGYRDWVLIAAHIRQNHAHVVVAAEVCPEKAMNDFKAYASRALKRRWGDRGQGIGRGMGVRGGCGMTRRYGRRWIMWWRVRGRRWRCIGIRECMRGGRDPLADARGSEWNAGERAEWNAGERADGAGVGGRGRVGE